MEESEFDRWCLKTPGSASCKSRLRRSKPGSPKCPGVVKCTCVAPINVGDAESRMRVNRLLAGKPVGQEEIIWLRGNPEVKSCGHPLPVNGNVPYFVS